MLILLFFISILLRYKSRDKILSQDFSYRDPAISYRGIAEHGRGVKVTKLRAAIFNN
jgi:hypothetical protein